MKTKLFTTKSFFVMLMSLVLALGIIGVADALTLHYASNSGDLSTVAPNQKFTIRVSVRDLKSPQAVNPRTTRASTTDIEYAALTRTRPTTPDPLTRNYTQTVDTGYNAATNTTHYYTVTNTSEDHGGSGFTLTTNTRNWLTESAAYYYNDESVSITTSPTITLMKGDTAVTSLIERHEERDRQLSSSITLTGSHATAAAYDITITDNTDAADIDGTPPDPRASITFTVFVVNDQSADATEWGFTGLTNLTEKYKRGGTDHTDAAITTASTSAHIRVEYSVIEGAGSLYVQKGTGSNLRRTSARRTITTSSAAVVHLDMGGSTNKVKAEISDATPETATFIFGNPKVTITGGNEQDGIFAGQLDDPLVVKVTDGKGRALSGLAADFASTASGSKFIPVPGTTVYTTDATKSALAADFTTHTRVATSILPPPGEDIVVQTDSKGEAKTYFQLGTVSDPASPTNAEKYQVVTVSAVGKSPIVPANFSFTAGSGTLRPTISILSGNNQSTDSEGDITDPLIVVVRRNGNLMPGEEVTFRTIKGTIKGSGTASKRVKEMTDGSGLAQVTYYQDPGEGSDTVTATISGDDYEKQITFNINGNPGSTTTPQQPQQPTAPTATSVPSTVSGTAGGTATLRVTAAANTTVTAGGLNDTLPVGSASSFTQSGTTYTSTLTLPSTAGTYSLSVFVGTTRYPVSVTVTAGTTTPTTQTGTLSVDVPFSGAIGSQQVAEVTATDSEGNPVSGVVVSLSVTTGGGVFTPASVTTGTDGTATSTLTRGTTAGTNYFVSASATGYDNVPKRISNTSATPTTGSTPTPTTPTPTTPTAGTPSLLSIEGEATRTGTLNEALDAPLVVEVLDSKGARVSNARVVFRVRTGQGRLSQRGNGRAIADVTDSRGNASAAYTPMSARSTVEASVGGVKETVTFTITTDGSAPAATPGTSDTPRTTTINPVVKVKAANRPPMLWVDGGAIYALVGADVQAFAPSVDNALNIVVGGGKVYWTEKTGESAGTINSANLDGTQVKELKSILAVPMGIAVDIAGSKLYWTNSRGRIQSANLDGSGIKNVLQNLSSPMDIALAGGNAYWTEATGAVKFVNLTGNPKNVRNISTGTDAAGSLAISGNKVYWTEMTGTSAGTVNSANLDGTGAKQLASIRAVPMGIAVDGSRSKLYWTNSRGRVQSANLNGSKIQNVVDGLGMPSDMVLSNSLTAPVATTTPPKSTTTASNKYDVNGDGSVDSKDVDTLLLAVLAEVTASKYDVNGDGAVDAKDVRDVNKNLDDGAAGAPALLGSKFSALEVDRLQEQIDLLIATNDRSPAAMRTLVYLQQLIVMARPEKTQLLANYPNPFNPETWIPYELATDTDVRLTIYNAQGVVIRVLHLGQQSAGYYTDRERAAYWDGRNALGEQVASGIYFYQLETDDMSSLRKMVILK